jgi:hypothetical protein
MRVCLQEFGSMNTQIILKDFSVPLLCVPKEWCTPKKGHPGVSRPKGSPRQAHDRGNGKNSLRSDSLSSLTALIHLSRLRSDGDLKKSKAKIINQELFQRLQW